MGGQRGQRPQLGVEAIQRADDRRGFHIRPKRWRVERPFARLVQNRRRVRDYEPSAASAPARRLRLMLRRLA